MYVCMHVCMYSVILYFAIRVILLSVILYSTIGVILLSVILYSAIRVILLSVILSEFFAYVDPGGGNGINNKIHPSANRYIDVDK